MCVFFCVCVVCQWILKRLPHAVFHSETKMKVYCKFETSNSFPTDLLNPSSNSNNSIAEGERTCRQINESFCTSGDVSGVKCVNTEQICILCAPCSNHTGGSLFSSHLKRPWQEQACQVAQQMALCSPSFPLAQCFGSTVNPLAEESAAFLYLTNWMKPRSHSVNPHYFIEVSLSLHESGRTKTIVYLVQIRIAFPDSLSILRYCCQESWCCFHLECFALNALATTCMGCFMGCPCTRWNSFLVAHLISIVFPSSKQSLTHFHISCFLKCPLHLVKGIVHHKINIVIVYAC